MDNANNKGINMKKLFQTVLQRLTMGYGLIGGMLFLFAGTFQYWNAWIFLVAAAIPMTLECIYLFKHDPELLEKRTRIKEKEQKSKAVINLTVLFETMAFIIPGLDYRFGWSTVPLWLVIAGIVLFEIGDVLYINVMLRNRYASRVIEIQENHQLVDSGLYSIVRHPMYAATIITDLSIPLMLGSYPMLIPMMICCALLIPRIQVEEDVLKKGLPGYTEYMKKVQYRLIPGVW